MIAPAILPEDYRDWNCIHAAPYGRPPLRASLMNWAWLLPTRVLNRRRGPFAIQKNNTTREFEYPWAFASADLQPGMRVVEIGGSLSGFQFVLSQSGCKVINIDPGMEAVGVGWPCDESSIKKLNSLFRTDVELRNTVISRAGIPDASIDRFFSISVLEHLPEDDLNDVLIHAYRCLKPGGLFIMTVDLFLNLRPFTDRVANEYGINQDISSFLRPAPFELLKGKRSELYGFDDFDFRRILANVEKFFIGSYPALVQCVILRKPAL